MKKIIAILGMLCLLPLIAVGMTSTPATAAGCGAWQHASSTTGWVASDNLKIAGRPLKWTFGLDVRECDGYDEVKNVSANLSKSNIGCQAVLGYTDGYKFNPNSLGAGNGAVNGGEKWVDCIGSAGNYGVTYPAYDGTRIGQYMDANQRCLNFTFTVDIQAQADPAYTNADPICINGL